MKKLLSLKNIVVSLVGLLIVWQLAFWVSDVNAALFPSPLQAFQALLDMVANGVPITAP